MWKGGRKFWSSGPFVYVGVTILLVVFAMIALNCVTQRKGAVADADREWRAPTPRELSEDWRRRDGDRYAVARGDFDGDGKPDVARLMLSRDGKKAAVVVSLSASGVKVIKLEEGAAFVLGIMGIEVLRAGSHETACGKGYFECEPGEPEVLEMRWDGIDYFKEESTDSVYYLPDRGADFRRIWLSD